MQYIQQQKELHLYFLDIDYIDIKTIEGKTTLREFIAGMLSYYPWWLVMLYRIRGILVSFLGLVKHEKPEELPSFRPEDISFTPGESNSFFIVSKAKEDHYWVSETPDDKHLIAFFGVVTEQLENELLRFHVFTTIKYKHWTGPVYFNIISPFHHFIASKMMKAGIQNTK